MRDLTYTHPVLDTLAQLRLFDCALQLFIDDFLLYDRQRLNDEENVSLLVLEILGMLWQGH